MNFIEKDRHLNDDVRPTQYAYSHDLVYSSMIGLNIKLAFFSSKYRSVTRQNSQVKELAPLGADN